VCCRWQPVSKKPSQIDIDHVGSGEYPFPPRWRDNGLPRTHPCGSSSRCIPARSSLPPAASSVEYPLSVTDHRILTADTRGPTQNNIWPTPCKLKPAFHGAAPVSSTGQAWPDINRHALRARFEPSYISLLRVFRKLPLSAGFVRPCLPRETLIMSTRGRPNKRSASVSVGLRLNLVAAMPPCGLCERLKGPREQIRADRPLLGSTPHQRSQIDKHHSRRSVSPLSKLLPDGPALQHPGLGARGPSLSLLLPPHTSSSILTPLALSRLTAPSSLCASPHPQLVTLSKVSFLWP
jgi:hypothetical protein